MQDLHSMQHHSKAIWLLRKSVQSDENCTSNDVLLIHFLLLLYEVEATHSRGLESWPQHLKILMSILESRRAVYGAKNYEHVGWWTFAIDTYILLSGIGEGMFVDSVLKNNTLSPGIDHSPAVHTESGFSSGHDKDKREPSILEFHRTILTFAARLGLLARKFRIKHTHSNYLLQEQVELSSSAQWRKRVVKLRSDLRETWDSQAPDLTALRYSGKRVPDMDVSIFQHVSSAFELISFSAIYLSSTAAHNPH